MLYTPKNRSLTSSSSSAYRSLHSFFFLSYFCTVKDWMQGLTYVRQPHSSLMSTCYFVLYMYWGDFTSVLLFFEPCIPGLKKFSNLILLNNRTKDTCHQVQLYHQFFGSLILNKFRLLSVFCCYKEYCKKHIFLCMFFMRAQKLSTIIICMINSWRWVVNAKECILIHLVDITKLPSTKQLYQLNVPPVTSECLFPLFDQFDS